MHNVKNAEDINKKLVEFFCYNLASRGNLIDFFDFYNYIEKYKKANNINDDQDAEREREITDGFT
jgi:hypothetical protein